jgi:tRNA threonylcarbamoyladenosine biosynthesis protein TsaE
MMVTTRGAHETEAVGAALAAFLRPGDLVALGGELGTGKTTFVKGVARGLCARDPVTSPTFTIVQEYNGPVPIAHVDLYRLRRVQELHELGLEELLDDHVVFVEWGDVVAPLLPGDRVNVALAMSDEPNARTIEITTKGPRWADREVWLSAALTSLGSA